MNKIKTCECDIYKISFFRNKKLKLKCLSKSQLFITFIPLTVFQSRLKSFNRRRRKKEAFNREKWWLPIWNRRLWIWYRKGPLSRSRWMLSFRAFVSLAVLDSLEISSTPRWLQWLFPLDFHEPMTFTAIPLNSCFPD